MIRRRKGYLGRAVHMVAGVAQKRATVRRSATTNAGAAIKRQRPGFELLRAVRSRSTAEGTHADRPTAGRLARQDAAICAIQTSAAEARRAIADSSYGFALVLGAGGVLLGRVRQSVLQALADEDPIEPIIEPGPSTIRPHLTPDELRRRLEGSDVRTLVVTRPDGTLLGVVRRDDLQK